MSDPHEQAPADNANNPEVRFAGLTGSARTWANLGVIGIISGLLTWMVMYANPANEKSHRDVVEKLLTNSAAEIKSERDAARSEAEKSRTHGTAAAEKLADASTKTADKLATVIEKSTEAIVDLKFALREEQAVSRETLKDEQSKTRENSNRLNEIRMKKDGETKAVQ